MKKLTKKSKKSNTKKNCQLGIPNDDYISLMKNKDYKENQNYSYLLNKNKINYYGDFDTEDNVSIDGSIYSEGRVLNYLAGKYDLTTLSNKDSINMQSIDSKKKIKDFDFLNSITDLQYREYKNLINDNLDVTDSVIPPSPYLDNLADVYESNMSDIEAETSTYRPQIEDRLGYLNTPVPPTPVTPSISYINFKENYTNNYHAEDPESSANLKSIDLSFDKTPLNNFSSDQSESVCRNSKSFLEKRNFKNREGDIGNLWMEMKQLKSDLQELQIEGFVNEDGDNLLSDFDEDKLMQQTFLLQCLKKSFDQLLREHNELCTKLDVLSTLPLINKNKGIQQSSKLGTNFKTCIAAIVKDRKYSSQKNDFYVTSDNSKMHNNRVDSIYNNYEEIVADPNNYVDISIYNGYNSNNKNKEDIGMQCVDSDFPENESDIYEVKTHFYNNYLHDASTQKHDIHANLSTESRVADMATNKFADRWLDETNQDYGANKGAPSDAILSQINESASKFISYNRADPQFVGDMLRLLTQIDDNSKWKNIIGAVNHVIGSHVNADKLDEMSNGDVTESVKDINDVESVMDINDIERLSLASLNASEVNSVAGFSDDEDYGAIHFSDTYYFQQAGLELNTDRLHSLPVERQKTFIIEAATEVDTNGILKTDKNISRKYVDNIAGEISQIGIPEERNLGLKTISMGNLENLCSNLQTTYSQLSEPIKQAPYISTCSNLCDAKFENIEYYLNSTDKAIIPINENVYLNMSENSQPKQHSLDMLKDELYLNKNGESNFLEKNISSGRMIDRDLTKQHELHLKDDHDKEHCDVNLLQVNENILFLTEGKIEEDIDLRLNMPKRRDDSSVRSYNYSSDFESEADKSSGPQSEKKRRESFYSEGFRFCVD